LFGEFQFLAETAGLIPDLPLLLVVAMEAVPAMTVVAEGTLPAIPTALPVSVVRQITGLLQLPLQTGLPLLRETLVLVSLSAMERGKTASTLLAGATCVWKKNSLAMPPTRSSSTLVLILRNMKTFLWRLQALAFLILYRRSPTLL
jgi:hypothetical protein